MASASSAAPSPRSLSSAGWMPRASSRSSLIASCASSRAWAISGAALAGSLASRDSASPSISDEGDQALLRAVVQVALDPPALGVRGRDDALPRAVQVVHAFAQGARTSRFSGLAGKRIGSIGPSA